MIKLKKELAEASLTEAEFRTAQAEYKLNNIDLNRVPYRGWRLYGIGVGSGPTYVVVWSNLNDLVTNRESIIPTFNKRALC